MNMVLAVRVNRRDTAEQPWTACWPPYLLVQAVAGIMKRPISGQSRGAAPVALYCGFRETRVCTRYFVSYFVSLNHQDASAGHLDAASDDSLLRTARSLPVGSRGEKNLAAVKECAAAVMKQPSQS